MNRETDENTEERLRRSLELLFSGYIDHDVSDDLRTISRYIEYLSDHIDYERMTVDVSADLLNEFESTCLLMQDRLRLHPESIQRQVTDLARDERLARTLAVIATLSPEQRRAIARPTIVHTIVARFGGYWARRFGIADEPLLRPENLFETKIGLNRLAQILKYASTLQLLDYDAGLNELRAHYDPSLIEKAKLLALINVARTQISQIEDETVADQISARLDALEAEVRKTRPRWGRIIAGFFVLFGFIANLKTLAPDSYDAVYKTMQAIIGTLHQEGSTEYHKRSKSAPVIPREPVAILPAVINIPKKDGAA